MNVDRQSDLLRFAAAHLARSSDVEIEPASADASFRSYWRLRIGTNSWVVMDSPPGLEDIRPWLDIGARLRRAGLHAPEVYAADADQGFILMEDLGARTYLPELNDATAAGLYRHALNALLRMQCDVDAGDLPAFDATRSIPEMELLGPWFLERHLGFQPDCDDWDVIEQTFRLLADSADEQPRRFMHRDFHSRNLLIARADNPPTTAIGSPSRLMINPGIVDFQGAMLGPVSYDLASLLRDCYIAWPIERVDAWVEAHRNRLATEGIVDVGAARFRRWFDLIGLQRHIKVLGIFCRLWYRDGKAGYLADLPRVLDYVLGVAGLYPQLLDFAALLQRAVGDRDISRPRAIEAAAGA
jgi:N-acetylmuramate 1-kinase